MIPPLLMDVRPSDVVLDMCAAPGSKAAQLLEMIHVGEEARVRKTLRNFAQDDGLDLGAETQDEADADLDADPSDSGRATGLLIANDADYKRGHMLVHQLKRLSSPNLLVTNHDATQFPSLRLPNHENQKNRYLKFDRILADVPCSGDGTLRKNINLWKDWQPGNALGLHITQIRILVRALQLLKPGGKVVYSTCSLNPVENEAVVGAAIDRCGGPGVVNIVDCGEELPKLKRYPGLKSWKIMDKASRMWGSWEEVEKFAQESNDGVIPGRVVETMFPVAGDSIPLDRCMRVYPHMQDTGGFFITVLEKKAEFRARNENQPKQTPADSNGEAQTDQPVEESVQPAEAATGEKTNPAETENKAPILADDTAAAGAPTNGTKRGLETDSAEEQPTKKTKVDGEPAAQAPPQKQRRGPIEEPFKFLDPTHPVIQNIKEFYKLSTRFPDDRYMVRNEMGEPAKAVYYTTALMRDILTENEGRGIRFIHGGVRMFMKQDAPSAEVCRWRIQAEGMPILQGYVGEARIIHLKNKETFRRLLIEMFPRIVDDGWRDFDEIGEAVRDIGMGCCVLRVEPDGSDPDFQERLALPLWKSIHSLNLMLPKEDRSAMLLRVFNDSSPLINTGLKKDPKKIEEPAKSQDDGEAPEVDAEEAAAAANAEVEDLPTPEDTGDAEMKQPGEAAEA